MGRPNLKSIFLLLLICGAGSAFGSVIAPSKSLRALAGRQVWVPICSRRGVNGSAAWYDNTNTNVMDQTACFAPSYGSISAIKLVFAGFDMPQQGETDRVLTATGTASIYVPSANNNVVTANGGVGAGSTVLNFASTALGANSISVGQTVGSAGGGVAANTYVTGVSNSFNPGSGNSPVNTVVSLSAGTTATTAAGQPFNFVGQISPVRFGGKRGFVIEPSHDVVTSDPVAVQLSPNALFYVRVAATMSAPGLQLMDYPGTGSRLSGEFDNRGTTYSDQTLLPTSLSNTGGGYWAPVAVLALVSLSAGQSTPGAVLILGDSIAAGTGDNADGLGLQGYIQRSFENNLPFVTTARGSTTAFALAAHGDGQYSLSVDTGVTDVLLEDGRNDLLSFQVTDAGLETSISQIAARYTAAGKRVWCFTVPPTTQSNDGWSTLANQTWTVAANNVGSTSIAAGSVTLGMQSVANITPGLAVSGSAVSAGTTVAAIAGSNITLSAPTLSAIPAATRINFGTSTAALSSAETYRQAYNGYLRQHAATLGCTGVIDIDNVVASPSSTGKWRVDLGIPSTDGVHPTAVLHQALINAGLVNPSKFQPQ